MFSKLLCFTLSLSVWLVLIETSSSLDTSSETSTEKPENYGATWKIRRMKRYGNDTTVTKPPRQLSWTPGLEVRRMLVDGEEIVFRIAKGERAALGDVPYQMNLAKVLSKFETAIGLVQEYGAFCGGTLITTTEIITAAHCFAKPKFWEACCNPGVPKKEAYNDVLAWAGTLDTYNSYYGNERDFRSNKTQFRKVRNVLFHKKFNFPEHDMGVAFLQTPFIVTKYVAPINYAVKDMDYTGHCLVSGFGRVGREDGGKQSRYLKKAELMMLSKKQCSAIHKKKMDLFICTSDAVADTGQGDSGGPLVCKGTGDPNEGPMGVLVGIVSGKAVHRESGSFFVRMSSYVDTLKQLYERDGVQKLDSWSFWRLCLVSLAVIWCSV